VRLTKVKKAAHCSEWASNEQKTNEMKEKKVKSCQHTNEQGKLTLGSSEFPPLRQTAIKSNKRERRSRRKFLLISSEQKKRKAWTSASSTTSSSPKVGRGGRLKLMNDLENWQPENQVWENCWWMAGEGKPLF